MTSQRVSMARTSTERAAKTEEAGVREFLAFMLAEETYALPLACVREILRMPSVAEVPRAPADVLGIIAVRGQVVTLLDLRQKLALQKAPLGARTRVLLVDQGDELFGLLCDRVLQVYRLSENEVELASVLGSGASSYVMGVGRPGLRKGQRDARGREESQELLILLDPIALLKRQVHG